MKIIIPELRVSGRRLGRNINHDPRSLRFVVAPAKVDKTVAWERHAPILDQSNLGSCTGNAEVGEIASDPFYDTLEEYWRNDLLDADKAEEIAVRIYSLATEIDPYAGTYPPEDTGSDGLSVSKAAKQLGLISGYVWATSVEETMTLIQSAPFIIGTDWTTALDQPDAEGIVKRPASGSVRGGHEYVCRQRDAERDLWWFDNSWGDSWGKDGRFAYDTAGLRALLARGGDVTQSVPNTEAPPTPNPTPTDADLVTWWTSTKPWTTSRSFSAKTKAGIAARACAALARKKGL